MRMSSMFMPRSGSTLVMLLLGLAVLVTAGLSFEAVRSARSARATAEGVLRDYAAVAAVQFARESHSMLDGHIQSGLSAARQRGDSHVVDHAGQRVRDCDCTPPFATEAMFAVSRSGVEFLDGEPLDPALVAELSAGVSAPRPMGRPVTKLLDDGRLLVTSWGIRDRKPVTVGFIAGPALLDRIFDRVLKESDLLPGTLVDRKE